MYVVQLVFPTGRCDSVHTGLVLGPGFPTILGAHLAGVAQW